MKSIKEKAIEVFDDPFKQECFEAGANYVLEQIEKLTHNQKSVGSSPTEPTNN